jgi:hypothetical protein
MLTLILLVRKPLFVVPFLRDDLFVGREDILVDIDVINKLTLLHRHSRAALVGLGGVW